MPEESAMLMYNNRPLVRCGNEIYYGNMTDKFIILMKIESSHEVNGIDVPDKISIQLQYTDPDIKGKGKIVKTSEKDSFENAMELACAWLDRIK